ncbi:HIRAN domain-containing protein [Clostridium sp. ZBS15]|uniref:HIRAN domain-containing protein n=1 Tax=Clostridium sp. ZBS15 TaxID=2949969 RepID=UPI00207ABCBE|nr:HIRAN domain-containing protein [Clostridium sp. ZBS15]
MAFKGASPGIFSDVMDDIINEETNIPYEEWSAVYRYRKDNYGTCLRKIEFASDYTMSDHKRYSEFNKESETIVENNNADVSEKMCTCVIGLRNEKSKAAIEKLKVGDIVKLLREPNNIYAKDAIAVYSINNEMLGYIARDDEKELAEFIDREAEHEASVTSESGGNRSNYVVNIQVTKVNIASYTSNNFNK